MTLESKMKKLLEEYFIISQEDFNKFPTQLKLHIYNTIAEMHKNDNTYGLWLDMITSTERKLAQEKEMERLFR